MESGVISLVGCGILFLLLFLFPLCHSLSKTSSHSSVSVGVNVDVDVDGSSILILVSNMSFTSIPLLDLSLSRNPETKPAFLESLREALLEVGFLYIKNTGIDDALIEDVITQGKAFFDLPEEKKLEIQMKNVPSFLGATRLDPSDNRC